MSVFNLPDLGEGLPDAEIVEWLVAEGDTVKVDQPMVSMETAKAVVEVPSPFDGVVTKLHGAAGDVIDTGAPLISFDTDAAEPGDAAIEVPAAADDTNKSPAETKVTDAEPDTASDREDAGTVVGQVDTTTAEFSEQLQVGQFKVTPAVRAMARKLKVDLANVSASGVGGVITMADVKAAAGSGGQTMIRQAAPSTKPTPVLHSTPKLASSGKPEPIRGTRRTMARAMAQAHAQIVPTTLFDDADIQGWDHTQDITVRLIRALVAGAATEPSLNAWFDMENTERTLHQRVDIGIAVDTADGLFVPAIRGCESMDSSATRQAINRLRDQVKNRSIPREDLQGDTRLLSNFGVFAGRYATPVITPPCVAILAAGKLIFEPTAVMGGIEVHRKVPLSLTFDHRAATGGEAARFLAAVIGDLEAPV